MSDPLNERVARLEAKVDLMVPAVQGIAKGVMEIKEAIAAQSGARRALGAVTHVAVGLIGVVAGLWGGK